MKKVALLAVVFLVSIGTFLLVNNYTRQNNPSELRDTHANFIKNHPFSETFMLSKAERKALGIPPNAYYEQEYLLEMNPRTGRTEPEKLYALQKELQNGAYQKNVPGTFDNSWEERGPRNVPGRTRAMMFDPNDATNKRVIAGGVSGGLWKIDDIENVSASWQQIGIPDNLAVSSITYDENNTQNMFIGTGESYVSGGVNGDGIWRSTDGGATWEHVFGGHDGNSYLNGDATLTVNSPGSIADEYPGIKATFGPQTTSTITSNVVLADDGSANPTFACNPLINGAAINGNIAVIQRGECAFVDKVMNAQNAGAIAVIVVNSFAGPPIAMGGTGTPTIPSMMISRDDGDLIINELGSGDVNVSFDFDNDNEPTGTIVPGSFHINDIRTRDNGGSTEIYAAVSDTYYSLGTTGSTMGAGTFGLYKSTDNGDTWNKLILPQTTAGNDYMPNDIEITTDNKIWISTMHSTSYGDGGGAILSSSDGVNFSLEHTIAGGDRTELAVSSTDPNKIYVLVETSLVAIYKTTDAFATAPSVLSKPVDAGASIPANDFTRGQAFYDLMIAVDPNDDEILYVGGIDAFRSSNGGSSWSQMSKWTSGNGQPANVPLVHADQHELVFHPTDSDKGIMATDGGVFYASSFASAVGNNSAIGTRKWDYNTTQFYKAGIGQSLTNERLLAGAQDNGTLFKVNAASGTNSFTEIYGGDGGFCFIDKDEQYMVTSYVYNTFNRHSINGAYQASLISDQNSGSFINMADLDDNLEILYTDGTINSPLSEQIARVKNVTGTPIITYLTDPLLLGRPTALKVSPYTTTSSKLFVGTTRGNLFRLDNADTSPQWTKITGEDFFGSVSSINFGATEDEILVTFHNYGVDSIWFTEDGGVTWLNKEGNFPDIPVKDIMMNPLLNDEVIIATDLGVWFSANFDDTTPNWEQSQNGMQNVKVTSFDLRTADNKVAASTYGRGLFTGYFTAIPASTNESNELSNAISVYPTLVTEGSISVSSSQNFDATGITIFNVQGKQVFYDKMDLSQDEKTLSINLKSGIYFMNFSSNGLTTSKKIIVQ